MPSFGDLRTYVLRPFATWLTRLEPSVEVASSDSKACAKAFGALVVK